MAPSNEQPTLALLFTSIIINIQVEQSGRRETSLYTSDNELAHLTLLIWFPYQSSTEDLYVPKHVLRDQNEGIGQI